MPSLAAVVSAFEAADAAYWLQAPDGWTQGRTLYGGMTAALSLAATTLALPGLAPLRSAQSAFIGPASGRLAFRPTLLRQGRSATLVAVDCEGEGGLAARTTLVFGNARDSRIRHDLSPAPPVADPEACPAFFPEDQARPGFFQNFQVRLAAGARPVSGAQTPQFTAWVRLCEPEGADPAVALLALADSLPPAAMVTFPQFAPISTMTWAVDLHQPVTGAGWRLLRSTSEQAGDGYSLQAMELWDQDGRRLAAGRQVVAIFT